MRAGLFVLRGVDVQIRWHRQEYVQLKWKSAKWLCDSLFWGELANNGGFIWLNHTSVIAIVVFGCFVFFAIYYVYLKLTCGKTAVELIASKWEKSHFRHSQTCLYIFFVFYWYTVCETNHFSCKWNKHEQNCVPASYSRASGEWALDGKLPLTALREPAGHCWGQLDWVSAIFTRQNHLDG